MSFLDEVQLLEFSVLEAQLSATNPNLGHFLKENRLDILSTSRSQQIREWEQWCKAQTKRTKLVEADVPDGILPKKCKGTLTDIKVSGGKFGPDDTLYNRHADLREKVARGNTVLFLNDHEAPKITYDNIIFALKKFTGGMGDEDEDQPDDNKTWMDYFLKPVSQATRVVCTRKANGEAAHFSVRFVKDRFVVCAGSKNVHLLVRCADDIAKYRDSRFLVAKTVAESVLRLLSEIEVAQASTLLSFMHYTQVTAVFEVLQPHYQHVVDLSYLDHSELHFITWTLPYGVEDKDSYCALAPDLAIDFATSLGLRCIEYAVVPAESAEDRMELVRRGYGYEGEVLYFLDAKDNVIGLLKKKTAWYVLSRAIREKASSALLDWKKCPDSYSHSSKVKKLATRLVQIQKWLGFGQQYLDEWTMLGGGFLEWLVAQSRAHNLPEENVRGKFPVMWKRYLTDKGLSDQIEWIPADV